MIETKNKIINKMPIITEIKNNNSSSLIIYNGSNSLRIPSSPKRKVLISPSKDLLSFFNKTTYSNSHFIKPAKVQK